MRLEFWGTRGSVASPGPETERYGGNTSSVSIRARTGAWIALDAGTGIRRFGQTVPSGARVDILLTHLHLDHIQGLGFFAPLYDPTCEVHVWGPGHARASLRARLARYLSPPLFPVRLRDVPCQLSVHEIDGGVLQVGGVTVTADRVCHPDPTLGYRVEEAGHAIAYLPDHEPALGARAFPGPPEWTSGYGLAAGVDVLIHDAQFTAAEYPAHVGWGHSSLQHAIEFARVAGVGRLVAFHHDPSRTDAGVDLHVAAAIAATAPPFAVIAAAEGLVIDVPDLR